MTTMNVLVSCGSGRKVWIARGFREALTRFCGGEVIVIDQDSLSPAFGVADRHYVVPNMNDEENFVERVKDICKIEQIKIIIPTTDRELEIWTRLDLLEFFKLHDIFVPGPRTRKAVDLCNDKLRANEFFRQNSIPYPEVFSDIDSARFPVIIKPRCGAGSKNCHRANNKEEGNFFSHYVPDNIIQEFVIGREFTIDVFKDNTKVLWTCPRERLSTRAGVMDKGCIHHIDILKKYARVAAEKLDVVGPINIQGILVNNKPYFLEINPRLGGGTHLTIEAGYDICTDLFKMARGDYEVDGYSDYLGEGQIALGYDQAFYVKT